MHHFAFVCSPVQPAAEPRPDQGEISELGYFEPDSLPRPISDFTLRRIADALAGAPVVLPTPIGSRRWVE